MTKDLRKSLTDEVDQQVRLWMEQAHEAYVRRLIPRVIHYFQRALTYAEERGLRRETALICRDLGYVYVREGALEQALAGKFKGTTVTMDGPFSSGDQVKFEQSIKAFEDATGINIVYIGGKGFEGTIGIRVEGGNPPDIADFPQPGLLETQVRKGAVADLSQFLPAD